MSTHEMSHEEWFDEVWWLTFQKASEQGLATLSRRDQVLALAGAVMDAWVGSDVQTLYEGAAGRYAEEMAEALDAIGEPKDISPVTSMGDFKAIESLGPIYCVIEAEAIRGINRAFPGGCPAADDVERAKQIECLPDNAWHGFIIIQKSLEKCGPDGDCQLLCRLYDWYHSQPSSERDRKEEERCQQSVQDEAVEDVPGEDAAMAMAWLETECGLGHLREAKRLFEQVLALKKKAIGTDHPEYGNSLWHLGVVETRLKEPKKAGKHLQDAVHIIEAKLGSDSPKLIEPLLNLAELLLQTDKVTAAEAAIDRARELIQMNFGSVHYLNGYAMAGLARVRTSQQRYDDALKLLHKASAIFEKFLELHPERARIYDDLTLIYRELGLEAEARRTTAQAAELRERNAQLDV